ncbi:acyl-CoA thioesterase [Jiella sp. KSK16Y-1]|uniref:Acyl-CoA thioesterase n=2 Tax=Jiella mangrovi TaxID=2821407 RepID=A0ABS4BLJ7_9HYPH|nr:acyl-CoA thioesterase [Jiella mangrovi]
MWGLGFFYSMHVVWIEGWAGFVVFALANCCGLATFGCVLGSRQRNCEAIFHGLGSRFASLFFLCQIGAVAITLFALNAYLWPQLLPQAGAGVGLCLTALVVVVACIAGRRLSLERLRLLHTGYLGLAFVAIAVVAASLVRSDGSPAEIATPDTQSIAAFLLPTLVGFALGPWSDIQQWQRVIAIRKAGLSPAVAYIGGSLVFLALLCANASLSRLAGPNLLVAADNAIGAQSSVAAHLGSHGYSLAAAAFALWAFVAALSTIDSFYCAARWYVPRLLSNSLHPALAFVSPAALASPLWILGAAVIVAISMNALGLSQSAYMMPYATLLVGATIALIATYLNKFTDFDPAQSYLSGIAAALVFFIGYREDIAILIPVSTVIALIGAAGSIRAIFFEGGGRVDDRPASPLAKPAVDARTQADEIEPVPSSEPAAEPMAPLQAENTNLSSAHGFDGQWFVMRVTPTYDDTNSVGNVYFANYVRWVGKARELFFNACMPNFDLETTRYYVLTRSFQHDFRREIAEFEPVTTRIRIVSHNRKFVTLGHEIISDRHGLLGRGEQSLMFVDRESFKPLDIPVDIVRGFLPYWPSNRPDAGLETARQRG